MISPFFSRKLLAGSRWDVYAALTGGLFSFWHFLNWPRFPFFIDTYYHLSVLRGFHDAGGWVGRAFWEYAPVGRPHLYPPLFHLLQLVLFRCGASVLAIAKFSDALIYPAALGVIWLVLRRTWSDRLAFFALFLAASSHSFGLSLVDNPPFTLSLLLGLLSWMFLEKNKPLSSFVCLAFSFYAHSLMPWLMVSAVLCYRATQGALQFRAALAVCAAAVAAAAPLLIHQARFLAYFESQRLVESRDVLFSPALFVLGIGGIGVCLKRRGRYLFFGAFVAGFLPLLLINPGRFFSGHGQVATILLASACLDGIWEYFQSDRRRKYFFPIFSGLALVFCAATPLVSFSPFQKGADFFLSSKFLDSLATGHRVFGSRQESLYDRRRIREIVGLVERAVAADEILFSNYNYVGGMIGALAHRATSSAMLPEVRPFVPAEEASEARLIVWFKDPQEAGVPGELAGLIDRFRLKLLIENEIAYLYINGAAPGRRKVIPATVPFAACLALIGAGVGILAWDQIMRSNENKG